MSGISTRIDKGQKRFQPKLKARPTRNKTTPSEDGTSTLTPTQPTGSESGSFGSLLLESDAPNNAGSSSILTLAASTTHINIETSVTSVSTVSTHASTSISIISAHNEQAKSVPASTTISSPTHNMSIVTPTKVTSQATTISIPSQSTFAGPSDAGSSSAIPVSSSSSNTLLTKPSKGASVISVPTARSHSEMEEYDESEEAENSMSPRKRSKGKSTRPRNQPLVYNEDGEEIPEDSEDFMPDYANMFMFEFTRDLGIGKRSKVFHEHQKIQESTKKVNKKAQRIEAIRKMEGRGPSPPRTSGDQDDYGEEDMDEDNGDDDNIAREDDNTGIDDSNKEEKLARAKSETSTPKAPTQHKTFAPQVRLVDGRIELDVDSLVVDHDIVEADTNQEPMEYVEESSSTKFTNNSTFNRRITAERWSQKDTDLFYEALAQWGTDFGIICRLFPSKTRVAVRNKYKREDRYNHSRVEDALNSRRPIDLDSYSKMIGTEFPEITEEDLIKTLPDPDEDDQAPLGTPDFDDNYADGEEIVEEKPEEETEEIIGMIE
ncbi:Transcription factor TFIIIB component B [Entomortierella lignicola]|nr:Transcription factor TFIIIB component B [Entomortierella lignicola]